jgi:hypothetical protein
MAVLTQIVDDARTVKVDDADIDKYVIELIRISKMYKFRVKAKPKRQLGQGPLEKKVDLKGIDEPGQTKEEGFETVKYVSFDLQELEETDAHYGRDTVKVKKKEYKVEKPKAQFQELWEKEGFYQERTTQAKVKVQLWPEHLPYDHFKRKKAFLFC